MADKIGFAILLAVLLGSFGWLWHTRPRGHKWHKRTCKRCGAKIDPSWGHDWIVRKDGTSTPYSSDDVCG